MQRTRFNIAAVHSYTRWSWSPRCLHTMSCLDYFWNALDYYYNFILGPVYLTPLLFAMLSALLGRFELSLLCSACGIFSMMRSMAHGAYCSLLSFCVSPS